MRPSNTTRSVVLLTGTVEAGETYLVRVGGRFAVGEGALVIGCVE